MNNLRKIVGTFTFSKAGKHSLRIARTSSTIADTQFMVDFLEFVPVSYLPSEGVD
jgi:hypothetical protein